MTTRLQLRDIIREILNDTTQWPDATLNAWINQGIRDYSHYFPYHGSEAIPTVAAQRAYTLGATYCAGIIEVLKVEYPTGNEPPTYLQKLSMSSPSFWDQDYYDLRGDPPNQITIAKSPADSEYINIQFTKIHTIPTGDSSTLTVPDIHLEAISLFCKWKAIEESEMEEMLNPDTTEFILTQIGLNATRAERIYRNKIAEYQQASSGDRSSPGWQMDKWDRIY
jgi:hypothetical protein